MSDPHLNVVVLTGFVTRNPVLRQKTSGQVKAEFSFEVNRPFFRATGEPVSDLFLVDAWEDIGEWTMDHVQAEDNLIIMGTLNKESYSTRGGREHLTIVKAKYIGHLDQSAFAGRLDSEATKADKWSHELVVSIADLVRDMLVGVGEEQKTDIEEISASS